MTPDPVQLKALRSAGWLYFLMVLTAPFALLYVPGRIFVSHDAAATASNLRELAWLVRLGIGAELFHQAIAVYLVLALYRLFKPVDESRAKLLVALGAFVSVPIMFVNVLNYLAALTLAAGEGPLPAFDRSQLDAMAHFFFRLHQQGVVVASVFWGLWLFPFGTLIRRSGFIPGILGWLLYIAGTGYLASACASLVVPRLAGAVDRVAFILEMGELPILFWLFYRAIRPLRPAPA